MAGHDLGQARLHTTARDHQPTLCLHVLLDLLDQLWQGPAQIYPWCLGRQGHPDAQGNGLSGQRSDDGIVAGHQLAGCRLVSQVKLHRAQLVSTLHP